MYSTHTVPTHAAHACTTHMPHTCAKPRRQQQQQRWRQSNGPAATVHSVHRLLLMCDHELFVHRNHFLIIAATYSSWLVRAVVSNYLLVATTSCSTQPLIPASLCELLYRTICSSQPLPVRRSHLLQLAYASYCIGLFIRRTRPLSIPDA